MNYRQSATWSAFCVSGHITYNSMCLLAPVHSDPDCSRFDGETHTTAQGVSAQDNEESSNTLGYGLPQELTVCHNLVHSHVRKYMFIFAVFCRSNELNGCTVTVDRGVRHCTH